RARRFEHSASEHPPSGVRVILWCRGRPSGMGSAGPVTAGETTAGLQAYPLVRGARPREAGGQAGSASGLHESPSRDKPPPIAGWLAPLRPGSNFGAFPDPPNSEPTMQRLALVA